MRDVLNPWHTLSVQEIAGDEDMTERLMAEVTCMEELDRKLTPKQLDRLQTIGEAVKKANRSKCDLRLMGIIWLIVMGICAFSALSHDWINSNL